MPYPLPLTRTEAYLAYKAGVIQQSDLKPSLAVPRNGIDAWLAYWTGLAADYPKREDGTPHILQEEEAYIAYLSGVINEYPEKCLRRVGAYLRYLISARWGRPDHPLNREELYLSLIKTQFIPSGDPSSDITIDGTAKAPFVDVKMYGDTFQQSYTGKNLLGASLATMQSENTSGTWSGGIYTHSGVTVTPVFSNGLLQRIELSGTATGNFTFRVSKSYSKSEFEAIATAGETYTLSGCPSGGSPTTYYLRVLENPYRNLYTDTGEGRTKQMPSISSGATQVRLLIGVDSGTNTTGLVYRPQFEKSATATSYEPYVGGQASPNPDYPQPVQTVTGEQTVTVVGKNIIDYVTGLIASGGGITNTINSDGTITTVGKPNADYSKIIEYYDLTPYLEDGATYTLSSTLYDRKTAAQVRRTKISDSSVYNYDTLVGAKTFTVDKSQYKYRMGILTNTMAQWGDESLTITKGYQLEKSSTGTAFAPYSKHTYEINLGKNLFDIAAASDVWIHPSGIAQPNEVWKNSDFIKVEPNTTYTLSGSTIEGSFKQFQYHEYSSDNESSYINQYAQINLVNSITFTTHTGCNFIRVGYRKDALKDIQLEAGSTATTYAPYKTPIELCKLGDYQDYIWKDGDDWKVHKATATIDFYGTSGWYASRQAIKRKISGLNITEIAGYSESSKNIPAYIEPLGQNTQTPVYEGSVDNAFSIRANYSPITSSQNGILLRATSKWASASAFNTWLQTNHLVLYYALATATDTAITDQTLIAQLEALVNGGAENGTTYIKVNATDPNLPGLLYVEAPKYE